MQMVHEMRRLRAEHAALSVLSESLAALVAADTPASLRAIEAARADLRDSLTCHLKCEDWALYPRLLASGDERLRGLAAGFVADMGDVAERFTAYDRGWNSARILADWKGFGAETRTMLALLDERIEREERDLYPRAEAIGEISLEPVETVLRRAGC